MDQDEESISMIGEEYLEELNDSFIENLNISNLTEIIEDAETTTTHTEPLRRNMAEPGNTVPRKYGGEWSMCYTNLPEWRTILIYIFNIILTIYISISATSGGEPKTSTPKRTRGSKKKRGSETGGTTNNSPITHGTNKNLHTTTNIKLPKQRKDSKLPGTTPAVNNGTKNDSDDVHQFLQILQSPPMPGEEILPNNDGLETENLSVDKQQCPSTNGNATKKRTSSTKSGHTTETVQ